MIDRRMINGEKEGSQQCKMYDSQLAVKELLRIISHLSRIPVFERFTCMALLNDPAAM